MFSRNEQIPCRNRNSLFCSFGVANARKKYRVNKIYKELKMTDRTCYRSMALNKIMNSVGGPL